MCPTALHHPLQDRRKPPWFHLTDVSIRSLASRAGGWMVVAPEWTTREICIRMANPPPRHGGGESGACSVHPRVRIILGTRLGFHSRCPQAQGVWTGDNSIHLLLFRSSMRRRLPRSAPDPEVNVIHRLQAAHATGSCPVERSNYGDAAHTQRKPTLEKPAMIGFGNVAQSHSVQCRVSGVA